MLSTPRTHRHRILEVSVMLVDGYLDSISWADGRGHWEVLLGKGGGVAAVAWDVMGLGSDRRVV